MFQVIEIFNWKIKKDFKKYYYSEIRYLMEIQIMLHISIKKLD